jgi:hypothetical protein
MQRLGASAMLALDTASALAGYAPAAEPGLVVSRPEKRSFPIPVIAVALGIAAAGSAPSLFETLVGFPSSAASFARMVPSLLKSFVTVAQGAGDLFGGWAIVFLWISAGLLTITGLSVARALPRNQAMQGGV